MTDERERVASIEPMLAAVDLLAPSFETSGLDELEIEVGSLSVRLARPRPATVAPEWVAASAAAASVEASVKPQAPAGAPGFAEPAPGMRFVTAPLTGIWYAAPSPGARPYLQEGDEIAVGQVVGLVEAMKLFNEIKSDVAGTVMRMLVETGTLVKRQQPLVEIDPR